ncbi:MAG: FimB/Mfa2 family fimbrial subunit [Muribaculaceae bacterium]|nr:FimB/Mfa2 family fimbrial subunit [Muribaculaceae bacterium]
MKHLKKNRIIPAFLLTFIMALFTSCNAIYEDLEPCEQGVQLRFVYDYNMEFANAFHNQVDCLTVLVYDGNGALIDTLHADVEETSDEDWRMKLNLSPGKYHLIAYGGIHCEESSFHFEHEPENKTRSDLKVQLRKSLLSAPKGNALHHLYYGETEVVVPEKLENKVITNTVYMMKNTNDFRILLAYEDGRPIEESDFEFTIIDDNTSLSWDNSVIPQGNVTYHPWTRSTTSAGTTEENDPSMMAYAEISTSRLIDGSESRLEVKRAKDGKKVVSIPLSEILLLLKSDRYSWMGNQEFLDRQSVWNLTFVLTGDDYWSGTSIVINNWVVRLNNIDGK